MGTYLEQHARRMNAEELRKFGIRLHKERVINIMAHVRQCKNKTHLFLEIIGE